MADVLLKRPDGKFVTVDSSESASALADGYTPATQEQLAASRQPGRAALEGVARGMTFGFAEPLIIDAQARAQGRSRASITRETQARKEENPVVAGASELGGAVGTALLTGGGASALVGGGIKGAAFEGGLYGMGTMISESTLENKDLTSERLAAGFVGGALASGAVAGGLNLVGKGASAAISKFGGKGLKGSLEDLALSIEERTIAEGNKVAVRKLEQRGGSLRDVVEHARDNNLPIQFTEEALDKAKGSIAATGAKTQAAISTLDSMAPLTRDVDRKTLIDSLGSELRRRFKGDIAAEQVVDDFIGAELEPLVGRTDLKWPELYKLQSRLRGKVEVGANPIRKEVYDAGRKTIRDAIFSTAENNGVPPGVLMGLQKEYAKGAFLSSAIENRMSAMKSIGGVTGLGLMDAVRGGGFGAAAGAAVLGPIGAPLGAVAGAYGNRMLRERGGSVAATAIRALSGSSVTNNISKKLAAHLGQVMSIAPQALGAYRYPLAKAAALGADALLEEHLRLASGPQGQDYLSKVALEAESPEQVSAAGARLSVLDAIESQSQANVAEQQQAIDSIFGSSPGRKSSPGGSISAKDFSKVHASIQSILLNPEKAFEQVPPEVMAAAPNVGASMAAKVVEVARYLDSKAPKNPYAGMPVSIAPKWEPDAVSLDRFNRYKEAVENPAKVLKNMAQGYISPEQVDAIKAVYPAMYVDLQQKISDRLMEYHKPLTYQQKAALAAIVGPGALGMKPAQVQILQQMQQAATGNDAGGGGMNKPDGRQRVDQEKNMQTQSQRIESR